MPSNPGETTTVVVLWLVAGVGQLPDLPIALQ